MKVTFYRTTKKGQEFGGAVYWNGKELSHKGVTPRLLRSLFDGDAGGLSAQEIERAMRNAPKLFTGSYLRAGFEL